jgi:ABC-type uncharacterized transport system substrate-binding protein
MAKAAVNRQTAATMTIPIVFESRGLVDSVDHPGGNVTGLVQQNIPITPRSTMSKISKKEDSHARFLITAIFECRFEIKLY